MGAARIGAGSVAALLLAALGAGLAASPTGVAAPTRGDLETLRRKTALLECELALAKTRKPYLVVDAEARRLRYRLLGMTMRELPLQSIKIGGLLRSGEGGAPGLLSLAGAMVLKEKDGDPRLSPLTPADVEAGAADENVADALPPEAPAVYTLHFRQPAILRVVGLPENSSAATRFAGWLRQLWPGGRRGAGRIDLSVSLRLEEGTAREVYRSLIPGERVVLIPPSGYVLPDAGQEAPGKIKPGRPTRAPAPKPGPPEQGVPFQIPPPIDAAAEGEARPANGGEPDDAGAPAVETEPDPDWQEVPPSEVRPTPTPGQGAQEPAPAEDAPPPSGGA